jgi:molybdenum cofactor guanylyltransferase
LHYQTVTFLILDYHTVGLAQALPQAKKQTDLPKMPSNNITAIILAGGAGRRVENRDKGLITWQGKPFIAHVSDAIRPQVDEILISCNRNFSRYESFCSRTVADTRQDFQGPLAGLEAAIPFIKTDLLVVVSCDMPHLPPNLVKKLIAPLSTNADNAPQISFAYDGTRAQYLCAALRRNCLNSLTAFLDGGEHAVRDWYGLQNAIAVDFSDQQACFRNYNHLV